MTHIVREMDILGSTNSKKEVVEGVTIIETPPMVVVGVVSPACISYQVKLVFLANFVHNFPDWLHRDSPWYACTEDRVG